MSEIKDLTKEIKKDLAKYLKVPKRLTKADYIILAAKKDLLNPKKKSSEFDGNLIYTSEGIFNIYVTKELITRSLIFTDTLIKLFRQRGHKVEVRTNEKYSNYNATKIIVEGRIFNVCIRETRKRVKIKSTASWYYSAYESTGVLSLRIEELDKHQWSDGKVIKLEDKLASILAYFEIRAKKEIQEKIEIEAWHKEYELKKKNENDLKKKRSKELNQFKSLIMASKRWEDSIRMRDYIKATLKASANDQEKNEKIASWAKWAMNKVDWYDPLIEKEDELFKPINRNDLNNL